MVPWGLVALCETRTMFLAGWCLVAANRAQQLPRPSLSLHPSQGVSLGDNVTLRCHVSQTAARVWLYKDGRLTSEKDIDKEQDTAEFSLVGIKQEDAVKYWCQYQILEPLWTSNMSDPVELRVTDPRYPPPHIFLRADEPVEEGMNVTIQCQNQNYGGIIFLHKVGHSAPIQHQEPNGGGTANFTLVGVTPADAGTYRCSFRAGGCCLLFSPLGNNVTLEVTMTHAPSGASPRSPDAVQFQVSVWVPPGDCEGLTYAELRAVTPSTCTPSPSAAPESPIIYAEVGTGRPC
ncbi:T-cell-interacting, activating receptor on myeloid cells protein 1-like isoform X8 [Numida meleagris]|uniref:T-cell-interacting, activating receptor on myeloid cells protein 1-like isoform X8 n=1 Tax=Numida meleagris TaxID=8996 RepID=UPI000B3DE121|nr:T-cell-interacting, activating receptor on myeloid cells protein 1-like isoform X8 [Numida meleagris]